MRNYYGRVRGHLAVLSRAIQRVSLGVIGICAQSAGTEWVLVENNGSSGGA